MTKNYHRPLDFPADRQAFIDKAAAHDDGCISVGGFAARVGQLRPSGQAPSHSEGGPRNAGIATIARLVQLARREDRLTPEQYAIKIDIDVAELRAAEAAVSAPEPRVLHALSRGLGISYQKLLLLAGHMAVRDEVLEHEVMRFAAFSGPMDKLTPSEANALHDLLRLLQD